MTRARSAPALVERRPQSVVVTLLGAYVHPDDRPVWSGGLVRLLGELSFSTGAARVALARLTRRDLLARVREGRLVHYRPTARAFALLAEGERRIFSLGRDVRPPEVWTLLWHAIPEERRLERARLARRLRFLGFGSLHDGTWIAPHDREHDVLPLLEELGIGAHAAVLVGRAGASADFESLVLARAWDLEALAALYRDFVVAFGRYAGADRDELDAREAFLLRTRLTHAFRQFPSLDPGLPEDLAPTGGRRAEAVALFDELYRSLVEPARRHFDAATAPPRARASHRGQRARSSTEVTSS